MSSPAPAVPERIGPVRVILWLLVLGVSTFMAVLGVIGVLVKAAVLE